MEEPVYDENGELRDRNAENEIKKIKLGLEHGMEFSESFTEPGFPPELEGEMLDQIQQWEDQYAKGKTITIYELAGKPRYKPLAAIPDADIHQELATLREILTAHGVHLDTLCNVEDTELYRFITKEFFQHQTYDVQMEGLMHCFTYEDFHPNDEYDITATCRELLRVVLDKNADAHETWALAPTIEYGNTPLTLVEFAQKLKLFHDSFSSFSSDELERFSISMNKLDNTAIALFTIAYHATLEGSKEQITFAGICTFSLRREDQFWQIHALDVPGLTLS